MPPSVLYRFAGDPDAFDEWLQRVPPGQASPDEPGAEPHDGVDLAEGRHPVFLHDVALAGRTLTVDVTQFLTGQDAVVAYQADHPDDPDGPPMADQHGAQPRIEQYPRHPSGGLAPSAPGPARTDRHGRDAAPQHRGVRSDEPEVGAGGEDPRSGVHDVEVGQVGAGVDHLGDAVVRDQGLPVVLGPDRDAVGVVRPGERGRVGTTVDAGDVGGGARLSTCLSGVEPGWGSPSRCRTGSWCRTPRSRRPASAGGWGCRWPR